MKLPTSRSGPSASRLQVRKSHLGRRKSSRDADQATPTSPPTRRPFLEVRGSAHGAPVVPADTGREHPHSFVPQGRTAGDVLWAVSQTRGYNEKDPGAASKGQSLEKLIFKHKNTEQLLREKRLEGRPLVPCAGYCFRLWPWESDHPPPEPRKRTSRAPRGLRELQTGESWSRL